jgi:hypothetical protein
MKVYVNDQAVHIYVIMTVRHALLTARILEEMREFKKKVYDEWGNEIGLDGALTEEARIYTR